MPKTTKAGRKKIDRDENGEPAEGTSADRSYYYDDAHGYEDYDPEKEKEDDDDYDD